MNDKIYSAYYLSMINKYNLLVTIDLYLFSGVSGLLLLFFPVFLAPSDKHGVSVDHAHLARSVVCPLIAISYGKKEFSRLDSYISQNMGCAFVFQVPAEQEQTGYPTFIYIFKIKLYFFIQKYIFIQK